MYENALLLYENMNKNNILKDNFSHICAIDSCTKLLDYEKGINIHLNIIEQQRKYDSKNSNDNIEIKTALTNFYGYCNDINNALNIFKSIENNKLTIITICSMMDAFENVFNYLKIS